jgi:hypothetical protein
MKSFGKTRIVISAFLALVLAALLSGCAGLGVAPREAAAKGFWITGDFHTHTWLTDGKHTEREVVKMAFEKHGLDWLANSEHGGSGGNDPEGRPWDLANVKLLGDPIKDKDGKVLNQMWRWQSLQSPYSWSILFDPTAGLQAKYPGKVLIQGLEWNVPSHEHASMAIINQPDAKSLADFEYQFDASDKDSSMKDIVKLNAIHNDAVFAARYLQYKYPNYSYVWINHPSRRQKYSVADIRDLNSAAPEVFFGFEGMPGHQKEPNRGGYDSIFYTDKENKNVDQAKTDRARTYGGADYMTAKVGGLWDSLLGEGRRFWIFVNSDFHSSAEDADFWPGEYAKTYAWASEKSQAGVLVAMKSGNVFIVHGDLIDALVFTASSGGQTRTMGQELPVAKGSEVNVAILYKSPAKNANGDSPKVDHVDLIAGQVAGMLNPQDARYTDETNPTARIIARFDAKKLKTNGQGYHVIQYKLPKLATNMYLRLRGTNLGLNVPNETDTDGNPLKDELAGSNDRAKAFADLWFYSNPIFISVK